MRNTYSIRKATRRPSTPHRRPTGNQGTVNTISEPEISAIREPANILYHPTAPASGLVPRTVLLTASVVILGLAPANPRSFPRRSQYTSHSPQQDKSPGKLGYLPRWPSTEPSQPITSRWPYREGAGGGRSLPRILPHCGKIIRRRPERPAQQSEYSVDWRDGLCISDTEMVGRMGSRWQDGVKAAFDAMPLKLVKGIEKNSTK
jgi:hypothetical protein